MALSERPRSPLGICIHQVRRALLVVAFSAVAREGDGVIGRLTAQVGHAELAVVGAGGEMSPEKKDKGAAAAKVPVPLIQVPCLVQSHFLVHSASRGVPAAAALIVEQADSAALQEAASYFQNDVREIESLLGSDHRSPRGITLGDLQESGGLHEHLPRIVAAGDIAPEQAGGAALLKPAASSGSGVKASVVSIVRELSDERWLGNHVDAEESMLEQWLLSLDLDLTFPESIGAAFGTVLALWITGMVAARCLLHTNLISLDGFRFSFFIDVVIVVNSIFIISELVDNAFELIEHLFNAIYFFEMCAYMSYLGCGYFLMPWEVFSFLLVAAGTIDLWVLPIVNLGMEKRATTIPIEVINLLRLLRIFRLLRLLRPKPTTPAWEIDPDNPAEAWVPIAEQVRGAKTTKTKSTGKSGGNGGGTTMQG